MTPVWNTLQILNMRTLVPTPQVYMDYDGPGAHGATAAKQIDEVITIDDDSDEDEPNEGAKDGRESPPMLKISQAFSLSPVRAGQGGSPGHSTGPIQIMTLEEYMNAAGVQNTITTLDRIGAMKSTPPSPRKVSKVVPPCRLCGKRFDHFERYESHMLSHQGLKANKCELCERKYARRDALRKHVKQNHPNEFHKLYGPPTLGKIMDLTQDDEDDNDV